MIVSFNSVAEFCEELEKEKDNIDRKLVRLTNSSMMSGRSPSIRHLSVVATFMCGDGMLVRLDHYCGDLWKIENQDKPVLELSERILNQVTDKCKSLDLEVRAGVINQPELSKPEK